MNFGWVNAPGLLGGEDDVGHPTTLAERAGLTQTGTSTAFVTSSGAIYSFSESTAFRVDYETAGAGPVTNVIFQTQTGGRRFDVGNIRLEYLARPEGSSSWESLPPRYKALDDPQTGAFAERLVSAFQWDLTGREVGDFRLVFSSPGSSMPLWEAQLDVVEGGTFQQELGYLLAGSVHPELRFQRPGTIQKNLPEGAETRFHLPGSRLTLTAAPMLGFAHAGWGRDDVIAETTLLEVVFADSDIAVSAIFAPLDYDTWRTHWFDHANTVLGFPADHLNETVSGPSADPDADGADNFSEFAFGGDPYVADPQVRAVAVGGGSGAPQITYRQPASANVEVTYQLMGSDDLKIWRPVEAVVLRRVLDLTGYWRVTLTPKLDEGSAPSAPSPLLRLSAAPKS